MDKKWYRVVMCKMCTVVVFAESEYAACEAADDSASLIDFNEDEVIVKIIEGKHLESEKRHADIVLDDDNKL